MEVLLHGGPQLSGWRTIDIHQAVLGTFALAPEAYRLTQLRYDLRKMKAHGLIERVGKHYAYRFTMRNPRRPPSAAAYGGAKI